MGTPLGGRLPHQQREEGDGKHRQTEVRRPLSPAPGTPGVSRDSTPGIPGPHRAHPQVLSWALQVQPGPGQLRAGAPDTEGHKATGSTDTRSWSIKSLQIYAGQIKSPLLKFCIYLFKRKPCISQRKPV